MGDNKTLGFIQEKFFDSFMIISYILIVVSYLGLSELAPKYLDELEYYIKNYVCLFLIWRFNPLRTHYAFTQLDAKIAFNAGLFILTTTALNTYIDKIKSYLKNIFHL
jgi:hypothetical protein